MAMREFVMSDELAGLHSWSVARSGQLSCERCGALAVVKDGTYYRQYPAEPSRDCEAISVPARQAENLPGHDADGTQRTFVSVDFNEFRLTFPNGCDPTYVAAVIGALLRHAS